MSISPVGVVALRDIAFIGVGRMAGPMARRFTARGWPVHLFDPDPEAVRPFRDDSLARVHATIEEVATHADVALLSLPTPAALEDVGEELTAPVPNRKLRYVVNTSTAGVGTTRDIAAALEAVGLSFVDAPVSGGGAGAARGSLSVIVSGDPGAVAACRPLFEVIGSHVTVVGGHPGQAQVVKLANNVLSLGALAATAEATTLTSRAGIPLDVAIRVLDVSSGRNSSTAEKFPDEVLTGRYDFGHPARAALKDVALFTSLADELGLTTPLARAVADTWRLAVAEGYGDQDCTRIVTMFQRLNGVDRG